ncbi:MAG: hypothetical protein JO110_29530 [Acetobacteraceae bacterium]|nr:hypothetical protein [Acetobacteraceae bacterium]
MKLVSSLVPMLLGLSVVAALPAGAVPAVCGPNPSDCPVVFDPAGAVLSSAAASEPGIGASYTWSQEQPLI